MGLMKKIAIVMAFVWATVATIPGQETKSDSGEVAKIRELEYAKFDAQRRKDNATLDAMFDNGLVWVEPDGVQLSKAAYLANVRVASAKVLEIGPASMIVHVLGSTAVVAGIYRERGVKDGRLYVLRARFIDTWALKNGKWVCIAVTATSVIS